MSMVYTTSELTQADVLRIDSLLAKARNIDRDAKQVMFELLEYISEEENGKPKNNDYFEIDITVCDHFSFPY